MTAIDVNPPILRWAQRRSGRHEDDMYIKFTAWGDWLAETQKPTFADLEKLAQYTRVPIGYFFLTEPPVEKLPIPDFRVGRGDQAEFSAELLDTIYLNQRRQAWYEDYLADSGHVESLPLVGSARDKPVNEAAKLITEALGFTVAERADLRSTSEARRHLITMFENLGGLVVVNSMVKNNTHRMLDLEEFRGFTLQSATAPLVFINANDTLNGQIFSLLHEFAHVWRGESGVSEGGDPIHRRAHVSERWCDAVAAEVAVPSSDLVTNFAPGKMLTEELDRLSTRYRCSTLVILLKLRTERLIEGSNFDLIYSQEVDRLTEFIKSQRRSEGGTFYNNQPYRVGETLSRAIIRDTRMGRTPMTEALRLLAFKRSPMVDTYAQHLGEA